MSSDTALARYTDSCNRAAATIISAYSTSFGASVKLLGRRHRAHVRNIYALVRIADELVDGVATEAGIEPDAQRLKLAALEQQTYAAMEQGYSSNPIVHAFAVTARECGIEREIVVPFFDSMRSDVSEASEAEEIRSLDPSQHSDYVYGSAEVVGLMCVRVFTRGISYTPEQREILEYGAKKLGAAFQNINFLRDLGDDSDRLHRDYLGTHQQFTERERDEWLDRIQHELDAARKTLPMLPKDARRAVRCALELFSSLTSRLAKVPAAQLYERRVRVPGPAKLAILTRSTLYTLLERA
jgi:phytoene/squalene synthetase